MDKLTFMSSCLNCIMAPSVRMLLHHIAACLLRLLQAVHNGKCNGHTESATSSDVGNCRSALTGWIILFGGIQLLLSQVKDFHSLW